MTAERFNANVAAVVEAGFAAFMADEPRPEWDTEHRIPSDASEKE